jgi:molybdenum cofactor cytidylyltransferase
MVTAANSNRIFAIVLAAGSATRFGSSKQLAEWNGEKLVQRATAVATQSCGPRTILVAGHDWNAVRSACMPFSGYFVINEKHQAGIGTSLAQAVRSIRHVAAAVIVLLADQPKVNAEHVATLIERWSGDEREIVASAYANTSGVPALFARASFDKLCELKGDQGARKLLDDPEFAVHHVEFQGAATDIDTVADLARLSRNVRS